MKKVHEVAVQEENEEQLRLIKEQMELDTDGITGYMRQQQQQQSDSEDEGDFLGDIEEEEEEEDEWNGFKAGNFFAIFLDKSTKIRCSNHKLI